MDKVTMKHIRAAGLCSRGLRRFATEKGLDFDAFLKDGMPIEEARKIDDAMVARVVAIAEADTGEVDG